MKKWKKRFKDAESQCKTLESLVKFQVARNEWAASNLEEKDEQLREATALSDRALAENALLKDQLQNVMDELSSERARNAEHRDLLGAEIVRFKQQIRELVEGECDLAEAVRMLSDSGAKKIIGTDEFVNNVFISAFGEFPNDGGPVMIDGVLVGREDKQ